MLVIEERMLVAAGTVNNTAGATNYMDGTAVSPIPFVTPQDADGALFNFDVSAIGGTPSMVFKLQMQSVFGNWIDVPGAATTAIATVSNNLLLVHPAITVVANAAISYVMPERFRVVGTLGGTTPSLTFGIGVQFFA